MINSTYGSQRLMELLPFQKMSGTSLLAVGLKSGCILDVVIMIQSLQMMCWWAHDPNGDEFKHHLARVPDYLWLAEDAMKMQSFGSQLATHAVIATGMVEEYGDCLKNAHFYIRVSQIKENPTGNYKGMYRHFTKGAWTFSDQDQGWVVSDCTAEALKFAFSTMSSLLAFPIYEQGFEDQRGYVVQMHISSVL
ncbi:hypothetical protein CASFOL_018582 [Castilleja foliolosa]|uniref:Uncharacterized protein n=1 Tax=Castilleja foliolosa TaxID=1961234 RepID=A0ABD3D810_9LAMI